MSVRKQNEKSMGADQSGRLQASLVHSRSIFVASSVRVCMLLMRSGKSISSKVGTPLWRRMRRPAAPKNRRNPFAAVDQVVSGMLQQNSIIGDDIQAAGIKLVFDPGNCRIDAISPSI